MATNPTVQLNEYQLSSIRESFSRYDVHKTGSIPINKLGDVMRNLGHDLDVNQIRELGHHVDTDGNGSIEWSEFAPLMAAKLKEQEEIAFYKSVFRMLDQKKRGFIPCEDLTYILRGLADDVGLTEEEIVEMVADVDADGNGQVSFDEFYTLMTTE